MVEQLDDKANAVLIAAQSMPLSDTNPDYPALQLAVFMMGGGFLSFAPGQPDPQRGRPELRGRRQLQRQRRG